VPADFYTGGMMLLMFLPLWLREESFAPALAGGETFGPDEGGEELRRFRIRGIAVLPSTSRRRSEMTRGSGRCAAILTVALMAGCSSDHPSPRGVILISLDTLRADRLSCYGHVRETSPALDGIAASGARFETTYTTAPWTIPAHLSMLTGTHPDLHRRPDEQIPEDGRELAFNYWNLDPVFTTLAEAFRDAGHATAAFVDTPWLVPALGFDQGFDTYDTEAALIDVTDHEGGIRLVARKALAWLDSLPEDRPFFLFLHVFDVHGPFTPPAPWSDRFVGDALYSSRAGERYDVVNATDVFGVISEHLVRKDREDRANPTGFLDSQYDGGIAFTDAELGTFVGELRRRGLHHDTILAISSDHGESLGEHRFFGHGVLYREVINVPFLLCWPARIPAGTVIRPPVSVLDIAPTLLDLAGLRPPAETEGSTLVPLLSGESPPELLDRSFYLEWGIRRQYGLIHGGRKTLLRFPHITEQRLGWLEDLEEIDPLGTVEKVLETFDLARDPGELRAAPPSDEELRALVAANSRRRKIVEEVKARKLTGAPSKGLDPVLLQRLREVGYLQDSETPGTPGPGNEPREERRSP